MAVVPLAATGVKVVRPSGSGNGTGERKDSGRFTASCRPFLLDRQSLTPTNRREAPIHSADEPLLSRYSYDRSGIETSREPIEVLPRKAYKP